jgi:hypothetical protein
MLEGRGCRGGAAVKRILYRQDCCVVVPSHASEFFYMNMRVYHIVRPDRLQGPVACDTQLIWCAVYETTAPRTAAG